MIYKIVTIEPNLLGSATAEALFITPILYFASGGASMLADFLKRREYEARNPETVLKLKEAERLLAEAREANAQKEEKLTRLKQKSEELKDQLIVQQSEALAQKDEEIKQLKERLGLSSNDC